MKFISFKDFARLLEGKPLIAYFSLSIIRFSNSYFSFMLKNQSVYWTLPQKISFRFVFILFLLFIISFNNSVLPIPDMAIAKLAAPMVTWISHNLLGLDFSPSPGLGGSGDTMFHYIMLLLVFIISVIGCFLWSFLDKTRPNYNRLLYWLTVMVRFYLGVMLIHYGIAKIIKTQFASPDLMRLISNYGDSSPMGLAWTFFGFSDGYNIFIGIAEVSCALLLFRRTVTLGAIIALMVSANIMAVNYFFDVPVKIISTALVVMSIFLLAPNFYRLRDFFLKGGVASLKTLDAPMIKERWLLLTKTAFKYLLIILCIAPTVFITISRRNQFGDRAPRLPLYGVYVVESFVSEIPVLKWEKLIIQRSVYSAIKIENNSTEYLNASVDTLKHQIEITFYDDTKTSHKFSYKIIGDDHLELSGIYFDKPLTMKLKRQHFELTERQFNWISENPHNR